MVNGLDTDDIGEALGQLVTVRATRSQGKQRSRLDESLDPGSHLPLSRRYFASNQQSALALPLLGRSTGWSRSTHNHAHLTPISHLKAER